MAVLEARAFSSEATMISSRLSGAVTEEAEACQGGCQGDSRLCLEGSREGLEGAGEEEAGAGEAWEEDSRSRSEDQLSLFVY